MATTNQLKQQLQTGAYDAAFAVLYGNEAVLQQRQRYFDAVGEFEVLFGAERDAFLFSAPGRTEVGGNHTDHQRGQVLAASVNLDIIAVAAKNEDNTLRIKSKGYKMDEISLEVLTPQEAESTHAASLIRGTAAFFQKEGLHIGGFDAYTTSDVLKGSGLSSSAAFEVVVGTMLNHFYNGGTVSPVVVARAGQYAENEFFGKPSGLMDQMASAVGGFVAIDFADPKYPIVEPVGFDFAGSGYALCIVDTGGNHADLTDEYAAIPQEMRQVAAEFGKEVLREVDPAIFYSQLGKLREKGISDRALLRAMHFFADNERVPAEVTALLKGDFDAFCRLILTSGRSSQNCLQNVFAVSTPEQQGLSLALAVTERVLRDKGAWRVHGGGFAGTIQAFVPMELLHEYKERIEAVMGEGRCHVLSIRPKGGIAVHAACFVKETQRENLT